MNFSITKLTEKIKQLEMWVGVCSRLEGRWRSCWSDDFAAVEVTLNILAGFNSAAAGNDRCEEEVVRQNDKDMDQSPRGSI